MICMVACDGKGVKETTVVSRRWCGMKLWSSLQGHFHVVQFAAVSKKRPSLTNNLVKKGQEGATELHRGAKVEVRRGLHLQWRQNMGSAIQEYEAPKCFSARKRKRKWTGWSLKTTKQKLNFRRQWWFNKRTASKKKTWEQYRKTLRRLRAKWLTAQKSDRDKTMKEKRENVKAREEAAARCTKVIKRRVLKKLANWARAEHLVKCRLARGRRKVHWKLLSECVDRETREVQERRLNTSKRKEINSSQCVTDQSQDV